MRKEMSDDKCERTAIVADCLRCCCASKWHRETTAQLQRNESPLTSKHLLKVHFLTLSSH